MKPRNHPRERRTSSAPSTGTGASSTRSSRCPTAPATTPTSSRGSEKNGAHRHRRPGHWRDARWRSSPSCRRPTTSSSTTWSRTTPAARRMLLERYPRADGRLQREGPRDAASTTCTSTTRASRGRRRRALSLGDKTLTFLFTPWVHWPETMSTWLAEDKILFSCDFFGSHYATSDVFADKHEVYDGAKRYYAEIMMPFGGAGAEEHRQGDSSTPIEIIAPSHGPVYDDPAFIIEAYRDWAGGEPQNIVCLPYVTMHDSTRLMVDHLTAALTDRGVAVERFDLTTLDAGELASSLVHAGTIVLGDADGAHRPAPAGGLRGLPRQRAQAQRAKYATVIGSYGWARQDGRDAGRHDAQAQGRVPRPGAWPRACRARRTTRRSTPSPTPSPRSTRTSRRATSPISRSAARD